MKYICIFLLVLVSYLSFSQGNELSLKLEKLTEIEARGSGLLPVYEIVKSNKLYYRGDKYKIKLPNPTALNGIAFIYYKGFESPKIPQSIALLIENYKSDDPIFYLDMNNNLDFTDDEPRKYAKDSLVVNSQKYSFLHFNNIPSNISNGNNYSVNIVKLHKKVTAKLGFYKDQIYTGKKEKVAETEYWLGDFRLNKRRGYLKWMDSTYQITIEDSNCNTVFGEEGDFFYTKRTNNKRKSDSWEIGKQSVFELGKQQFLLEGINSRGDSMMIQVKENTAPLKLRKGDNIKGVTLDLIDKTRQPIEDLMNSKKYTILYFWGTWCAPCGKSLPKLVELSKKFEDQINIIGLAYNDTPKRVKKYIEKKDIKWKNGFASEMLIQKLNINSYPTYLLIEPNGVIMGIYSLQELDKLF